jgi:hypothetical protein
MVASMNDLAARVLALVAGLPPEPTGKQLSLFGSV